MHSTDRFLGLAAWQWAIVLALAAIAVGINPPSGGVRQYAEWFLAGVLVLYLVTIVPLTALRLTFS